MVTVGNGVGGGVATLVTVAGVLAVTTVPGVIRGGVG